MVRQAGWSRASTGELAPSSSVPPSMLPNHGDGLEMINMTELQQLRAEIVRVQARRNRAYGEFRQCDLELKELWRRVREAPLGHTGGNGMKPQCSKV